MRTLIIMRGWPGSGKSTRAQQLADRHNGQIFSTDDYFIDKDGVYKFDPEKIVEAHLWNIQRCNDYIKNHDDCYVVVDNTNILREHMLPYLEIAEKYNCEVRQDIPVGCRVVFYSRNERLFVEKRLHEHYLRNKHGVPEKTIVQMYESWENDSSILLNDEEE